MFATDIIYTLILCLSLFSQCLASPLPNYQIWDIIPSLTHCHIHILSDQLENPTTPLKIHNPLSLSSQTSPGFLDRSGFELNFLQMRASSLTCIYSIINVRNGNHAFPSKRIASLVTLAGRCLIQRNSAFRKDQFFCMYPTTDGKQRHQHNFYFLYFTSDLARSQTYTWSTIASSLLTHDGGLIGPFFVYFIPEKKFYHFCKSCSYGNYFHEVTLQTISCQRRVSELVSQFPPKSVYFEYHGNKVEFEELRNHENDLVTGKLSISRYLGLLERHRYSAQMDGFGRKVLLNIASSRCNATLQVWSQFGSFGWAGTTTKSTKILLWNVRGLNSFLAHFVHQAFSGKKFVSCYSVPRLSYGFYLDPFQTSMWTVLACFFLFGSVTLYGLYFGTIMMNNEDNYSVPPFPFILVSFLLEDCYDIPKYLKKMSSWKLIFCIWGMSSVILSNCYMGKAINGVTSPLHRHGYEYFADAVFPLNCSNAAGLSNYTRLICNPDTWADWFVTMDKNYVQRFRSHISPESFKNFTFYTVSGDHRKNDMLLTNHFQRDLLIHCRKGWENRDEKVLSEHDITLASLLASALYNLKWSNDTSLEPEAFQIEKEITKCGPTGLVDYSDSIMHEVEYLRRSYPKLRFTLSKEEILSSPRALIVEDPAGSYKIYGVLRFLYDSGISNFIGELALRQLYFHRMQFTRNFTMLEEVTSFKRLGLEGNFSTVFVIFGCMVFICFASFGLEEFWGVLKQGWNLIVSEGINMYSRIIAAWHLIRINLTIHFFSDAGFPC